jgi:hypothetical protein
MRSSSALSGGNFVNVLCALSPPPAALGRLTPVEYEVASPSARTGRAIGHNCQPNSGQTPSRTVSATTR